MEEHVEQEDRMGEKVAQEAAARREDRNEREALWRRRIEEQAGSGLSVRAFCRREAVAEHSFYQWRRKFASPRANGGLKAGPAAVGAAKAEASFTKGAIATPSPSGTAAFARLETLGGARLGGGRIEIESRGGYLIRLAAGFDRSALIEALGAIEALER